MIFLVKQLFKFHIVFIEFQQAFDMESEIFSLVKSHFQKKIY